MSSRHLRQFRAGGRRAWRTIFPQAIERVRNLLCGIIRRAMAKFEMAKWESERSHNWIIAHASIRNLDPPSGGQTDVWPVQVCEKRAVSARFPAEEIDETSKRLRPRHIQRRRRSSGGQCPGSCLSLI